MPHGTGMLSLPCPIEASGVHESTLLESPQQPTSTSHEPPQQHLQRKYFTDYAHAYRKAGDKLKHFKVDEELHEGDICDCFFIHM